jgi:hypothetical protein
MLSTKKYPLPQDIRCGFADRVVDVDTNDGNDTMLPHPNRLNDDMPIDHNASNDGAPLSSTLAE